MLGVALGGSYVASGQYRPCEEEVASGHLVPGDSRENYRPVKIFDFPKATATESALDKGVHGTVSLKVRFLAGGRIGHIYVIEGLPEGLTDEAIKAARKIRFLPARENGRMVNSTEIVEYQFPAPGCVAANTKKDS